MEHILTQVKFLMNSVVNNKKVLARSYATIDTGWGSSYVNTSAVVVQYFITTVTKDLNENDLKKKVLNYLKTIYKSKSEFEAAMKKTKKKADDWNKLMKKKYGG